MSILTAVLSIAGLLLVIAACAWLGWNFFDYVVTAWNWAVSAYNALISTVPGWALIIVSATLFLAFLGIIVKVL